MYYGISDVIECSVSARRLQVQLIDAEVQERTLERRTVLAKEKQVAEGRRILGVKRRGYRGFYEGTVNQAEHGADVDRASGAHPSVVWQVQAGNG